MKANAHAWGKKNLSHDHYQKIDVRVEIGMRDCLRNNIYYCDLCHKI